MKAEEKESSRKKRQRQLKPQLSFFYCIALVFARLECQKLSTQSAAKAGGTIRAAPAAPLLVSVWSAV